MGKNMLGGGANRDQNFFNSNFINIYAKRKKNGKRGISAKKR